MSTTPDLTHTEKQIGEEVQTETKLSTGDTQILSYELDLLDNVEEVQTKIEKEDLDSKETTQIEDQTDVERLSTDTTVIDCSPIVRNVLQRWQSYRKNSDAIGETSTTSPDDNEEEITIDESMCSNKILGNILTRIKAFDEKSKQDTVEANILIDECNILNDYFHVIEENENALTDEDFFILRKGSIVFWCAADNLDLEGFFKTNSIDIREIFYKYFQLLNVGLIQKYLKNLESSTDLKELCRIGICQIVVVMENTVTPAILSLNGSERPTNYIELLLLMLNFIKTNLESSDLTLEPSLDDESITRDRLLGLIWNYSDKTMLVPDLIEAGYVGFMNDLLKTICQTTNVSFEVREEVINIIHNISRHDDGIKKLNSLNASEVIQEFNAHNEDAGLNTLCCMTLALLSTPEQIKNDHKRMNNVLDTLLEKVYNASLSSNNRDDEDYHLSEPLIVFVKLFNDDKTLTYIMEHAPVDLHTSSTVDFFINLFIDYYLKANNNDPYKPATCTALVNILWSVSFQQKYKQQLQNTDPKFKTILYEIIKETDDKMPTNQYVPQYLESIHTAAKGILFNIDELKDTTNTKRTDAPTVLDKNQRPLIMISYSHQDTEFCKQIHDEIEKRGYDIWIDFKYLKTGDLWEQIAAGMKRASLIICLMSEEYCKSKSCRWEATFALDKLLAKKPVIPVLLRQHELPDWLDIRIAMLKYIRFKNLDALERDKIFEVMDAIENSLPQMNSNLQSSVSSYQHELPPRSMTKATEIPSHSSNTVVAHYEEPAHTQSTTTKLENQNITSKNVSTSRPAENRGVYSQKPIDEWNKDDISQWFQDNEILTELRDLCHFRDGSELIAYTNLFLDTEKLQYQMYLEEFSRRDGITSGKKSLLLHEFTKFSNALRKLDKLMK